MPCDEYIESPASRGSMLILRGVAKVKVLVYSLISSLKTYPPTLHFTPWSLNLLVCVPFHLPGEHTVLQPVRCIELIVHIAVSVLQGTHFHLSHAKHLMVESLADRHTIETMSQDWEERNMICLCKSCTKRGSRPQGKQRYRHSATYLSAIYITTKSHRLFATKWTKISCSRVHFSALLLRFDHE